MFRTTARLLGSAAVITLTAAEATAYSNELVIRDSATENSATDQGQAPLRVRTTVRISQAGGGSGGDPGVPNHGLRVRSAVDSAQA
ncbi:Hypothetical protein A7982_00023 [Minicystis rosea]|nr:Hypothetical protein A7982_00023 [Minicystis rosea]